MRDESNVPRAAAARGSFRGVGGSEGVGLLGNTQQRRLMIVNRDVRYNMTAARLSGCVRHRTHANMTVLINYE